MAIPKIEKHDIIEALKYIDENGVPSQNQSTKYDLVIENGKKYPQRRPRFHGSWTMDTMNGCLLCSRI